jgi:acetyl esterase/lipase
MSVAAWVEVRHDLEYASIGDRSLTLDLYLPKFEFESAPCPVVLYLHGGGFMGGDKIAYADERLVPMARSGIAVASASYRFTDVATYPAQVHDVKAAVRWLRAHADEHGYRAHRVGAWGASAGGYLALMLGVTAGSSSLEGTVGDSLDADSSVQATCAWFPVTELASADGGAPTGRELPPFITGPPPEPSIIARLLGVDSVTANLDLATAASPVTHAADADGPFLLIHGDRDGLLSEQQSRDMHTALTAAGVESTLLLIAGANHEDPMFDRPEVLGAVAGFFRARL